MERLKVTILGCGWSGMAIGKELVKQGASVLGTTTRSSRMDEIRSAGIEPKVFDVRFLQEADSSAWLELFEDKDAVIVTLPPSAFKVEGDFRLHLVTQLVGMLSKANVKAIIVFSSTAVYPDDAGDYREMDAKHRVSRHTGVDLLSYEEQYDSLKTTSCILRFGGLIGPGKDISRMIPRSGMIKNSRGVLNLTHLKDIVSATLWLLKNKKNNVTFNLVCPKHPCREDFYARITNAGRLEFDHSNLGSKKVISQYIESEGYAFIVEDPLEVIA